MISLVTSLDPIPTQATPGAPVAPLLHLGDVVGPQGGELLHHRLAIPGQAAEDLEVGEQGIRLLPGARAGDEHQAGDNDQEHPERPRSRTTVGPHGSSVALSAHTNPRRYDGIPGSAARRRRDRATGGPTWEEGPPLAGSAG